MVKIKKSFSIVNKTQWLKITEIKYRNKFYLRKSLASQVPHSRHQKNSQTSEDFQTGSDHLDRWPLHARAVTNVARVLEGQAPGGPIPWPQCLGAVGDSLRHCHCVFRHNVYVLFYAFGGFFAFWLVLICWYWFLRWSFSFWWFCVWFLWFVAFLSCV